MAVDRAWERPGGLRLVLLPELRRAGQPGHAATVGGGHAVGAVHHHRERVARRGFERAAFDAHRVR